MTKSGLFEFNHLSFTFQYAVCKNQEKYLQDTAIWIDLACVQHGVYIDGERPFGEINLLPFYR